MATLISDDSSNSEFGRKLFRWNFVRSSIALPKQRNTTHVFLGLVSFDADPSADINVWLSSGGTHLWNPRKRSRQPLGSGNRQIDPTTEAAVR